MTVSFEPFVETTSGSISFSYLPALKGIQKTLSLATGFSMAAVDSDGNCFVHFTHPNDHIHKHIIGCSKVMSKALQDRCSDFHLISCPGGLSFMCSPIIIRSKLFGHILGGPVWEAPPSAAQVSELIELTNWTEAEIMHAVMVHPAPVPLDIIRGRELIVSLAELTAQIILDQKKQQNSIDTVQSLYDISTSISSSLELVEILPTILNSATHLLSSGSGAIKLVDRRKRCFQIVYKESPDGEINYVNRMPLDEDFARWVALGGHAEIVDSPEGCSMTVPLLVKSEHSKNEASESDNTKADCIGSIRVGPRIDGSRYTSHDLQVMGIVSGHASSAIDKAQVYSQALRQFRELEALQEVGVSLNSSVDGSRTLRQVLDHACDLLEAQTASVMLLEPDGKHLKIRVARGLSDDVVKTTRVRLGERISGKVALYGEATQLPKGVGDSGEDLEAALCVPLKVDNKVIGVLNVRGHAGSEEFTKEDLDLAKRLASMSAAAIDNAELHDELQQLFVESITALANSIDARDPYTRGHSERVAEYSVLIGKRLNFSAEEQFHLRSAALLHDIGKIKIRDHILNKPDKLSPEEYEEMKRHPVYGAGIMHPVKSFRPLIPYILHHHERFDGAGYPDRKQGEEIPLCARIICVADSFDAMTSTRPYRNSLDISVAINVLKKDSGSQFDPQVVAVFVELYEEGLIWPFIEKMRAQSVTSVAKSQNIIASDSGGYAVVWGREAH